MKTTDLYTHKHFGNQVQVTALAGNWVEFLSNGTLFWLEVPVFETAYQYHSKGDPLNLDLLKLRALAREANILIPVEIA